MRRITIFLALLFIAWIVAPIGLVAPESALANLRLRVTAQGVPVAVEGDYDFTLPQNLPCSATVTRNCLYRFTLATTDNATLQLVSTAALLTTAIPATSGPQVVSIPWTAPTDWGQYTITVTIEYLGGDGKVRIGKTSALAYDRTPDAWKNPRVR